MRFAGALAALLRIRTRLAMSNYPGGPAASPVVLVSKDRPRA